MSIILTCPTSALWDTYNDFQDWITFGGQIIKSGDTVEQTKSTDHLLQVGGLDFPL